MKYLAMTGLALFAVASGPVTADDGGDKAPLSYSYIEGAFAHDNFNANGVGINDRDGVGNTADDNFGTLSDATGNGAGGRISLALPFGGNKIGFHAVADFLQTSHDAGLLIRDENGSSAASGVVGLDQPEFRVALGLHTKASDRFSVFAELGITNNKVSFGNANLATPGGAITADLSPASGSKGALDARLGLRGLVTTSLELTGYARYHGNGDLRTASDGTIGFEGKVIAGAGAFYHFGSRFTLGADYEFGKPGRLRLVARLRF